MHLKKHYFCLLLIINLSGFVSVAKNYVYIGVFNQTLFKDDFDIQITSTETFNNKPLDVLYKATCTNKQKSTKRTFEIIKTDSYLKNFFMAEYVLVENINSKEPIYYPFGWENNKIKTEEFKMDCESILKGTIKSIKIK